MDAYRAVLRGTSPESPRAWLLAIAENVRRRRFRSAQRRPSEVPLHEDAAPAAEGSHEQAAALAAALAGLPEQQREAFVLREISGLAYDEIAGRTGSTVASVQMLLFRARRTLRAELDPPVAAPRRAGAIVPLPGWVAGLGGRIDALSLTPRAAGVAGAAALAVGGVGSGAASEPPVPQAPAVRAPAPLVSAPAPVPARLPAPAPRRRPRSRKRQPSRPRRLTRRRRRPSPSSHRHRLRPALRSCRPRPRRPPHRSRRRRRCRSSSRPHRRCRRPRSPLPRRSPRNSRRPSRVLARRVLLGQSSRRCRPLLSTRCRPYRDESGTRRCAPDPFLAGRRPSSAPRQERVSRGADPFSDHEKGGPEAASLHRRSRLP